MPNRPYKFFEAFLNTFPPTSVFTGDTPNEMMASKKDEEGWFEWRLIKGSFAEEDYEKVANDFGVKFPKSFVQWHKEYFFLDADISIVRLPASNPNLPLADIRQQLDYLGAGQLISKQLYPFGSEGNDAGPLVFDGRVAAPDNEFPVRYYDHEFDGEVEGLSEIIFSSFGKLLECVTHYMVQLKTRRNYEIIPDFFSIDPSGAGLTGIDYWSGWIAMQKEIFEEFGD